MTDDCRSASIAAPRRSGCDDYSERKEMTPAREAALEACARVLRGLVQLKEINDALGPNVAGLSKRYRLDAKNSAWANATAAIERLEGLSDE